MLICDVAELFDQRVVLVELLAILTPLDDFRNRLSRLKPIGRSGLSALKYLER